VREAGENVIVLKFSEKKVKFLADCLEMDGVTLGTNGRLAVDNVLRSSIFSGKGGGV